ncbi:hypothetical protein DYB32_007549, partial [Aphanomyces invadans]
RSPLSWITLQRRSLYWTPLADAAVEGSIWLNLDETKLGLDYTLLDKEFGQDKKANDPAVTSSTKSGSGNGTTLAKPKTVHLVDSKRQQNCSIALSRFRMAPKDIKAAIVALDDKLLTLERYRCFVDRTLGYEGDVAVLGETEKFFLAISDLPRLSNRLKAMEATLTFGQRYDDVKGKLKLLEQAYVDLKGSTKLLSLLEVVLAVGNYLNRGTSRGGAYGFKLDILPKLTQARPAALNGPQVLTSRTYRTYKRVAIENSVLKDKQSKLEGKAKHDESKRDLFQQFTDSLEGDASDIVANYRSRHHKGADGGGGVGGLLRKDLSRRRLSSTAGPATS